MTTKMPADDILEQMLSGYTELSKEKVLERLERERRRTNGFISDETMLRMIGSELGIEVHNRNLPAFDIRIADLVPSLDQVTVVGRVVAIFPPKTFSRRRSGKFASFLIADKTGLLRIVLWNGKTTQIESGAIKAGQIVRISRGYTKEGREGVELHVGERSQIEINPPGVEGKIYPTIGHFTTKVSEIDGAYGNKKVNIEGIVKKAFPVSAFERQDSTLGKVMRLLLADDTGEVSIVVWNEKVDELEGMLERSAGLQLVNAKVRHSSETTVEVHVDCGTYIDLPNRAEEPPKTDHPEDKISHSISKDDDHINIS